MIAMKSSNVFALPLVSSFPYDGQMYSGTDDDFQDMSSSNVALAERGVAEAPLGVRDVEDFDTREFDEMSDYDAREFDEELEARAAKRAAKAKATAKKAATTTKARVNKANGRKSSTQKTPASGSSRAAKSTSGSRTAKTPGTPRTGNRPKSSTSRSGKKTPTSATSSRRNSKNSAKSPTTPKSSTTPVTTRQPVYWANKDEGNIQGGGDFNKKPSYNQQWGFADGET
jgi:hypothetical protein